jgi:hypothetical protein
MLQNYYSPSPLLSPAFHLPLLSDIRISDHSAMKTISTRWAATVWLFVAFCASRLMSLPYPLLLAPGKLVAVALRSSLTFCRLPVPNLPRRRAEPARGHRVLVLNHAKQGVGVVDHVGDADERVVVVDVEVGGLAVAIQVDL